MRLILFFILSPLLTLAQFKPYIEIINGDSVVNILYADLVNANVNFKELKAECNLSTDNLTNRMRALESRDSTCTIQLNEYEGLIQEYTGKISDQQSIIFNKNSTLSQYDVSLKDCQKGKKYWERKYDRTMTTVVFGGIGVSVVIVLLLLK